MPSRLTRAAELVGNTAGTIEAAATSAGSKVQQGLGDAVDKLGSSHTADRIEKRTRPTRKAIAQRVAKTKKRTASAAKKAGTGKAAASRR